MTYNYSMRAVSPFKWGPSAWALLHLISFNPDISMQKAKGFLRTLKEILPCPMCREHFADNLEDLNFPRTPARLGKWMYDLHERVNNNLDKKHKMSYEKVKHVWQGNLDEVKGFQHLDLWKFLLSIVEAHPGKHVVTKEYMKASKAFWELLVDVLPNSMIDAKDHLTKYMEKFAIDDDVLVSRAKYKVWVERLYKEFEGREISQRLNIATDARSCQKQVCTPSRSHSL